MYKKLAILPTITGSTIIGIWKEFQLVYIYLGTIGKWNKWMMNQPYKL